MKDESGNMGASSSSPNNMNITTYYINEEIDHLDIVNENSYFSNNTNNIYYEYTNIYNIMINIMKTIFKKKKIKIIKTRINNDNFEY